MNIYSKKTLVLIHGFLSGRAYWHKQNLLEEYANIIKIDLPGFGQAADQDVCSSIEEFAQSVIQQITKQTDANVDLLGHSMGGMIAQEVVRLIPEKIDKLILFGTGPLGDIPSRFEPISISLANASKSTYKDDMSTAVASWFLDYSNNQDFDDAVSLANLASFESYCGGLNAMKSWTSINYLPKIKQDTLIIWGDKDRTYDLDQQRMLNANIQNSHLSSITNCAHNAHLEKPDLFNAIVKDFLYR